MYIGKPAGGSKNESSKLNYKTTNESRHTHTSTPRPAAAWNRGFFFILLISFLNEKVTANQEIFMMKYNITNKQIRHGPAARPTLVSRVSTYPYIYIVYSTLRYYELWKFNNIYL